MQELRKQIAEKSVHGCYLFYGEERYLIAQFTEEIKRALLTEEEEVMNLSVMDEPKNVSDIIVTLETLPFLAEHRLVILKNTEAFKPGDDFSDLANALENLEDNVVIFVETNVNKTSKMYKTVAKLGRAVEFTHQTAEVLGKWIAREASRDGKEMDPLVAAYFVNFVGDDMTNLRTQWAKLCSYLEDRTAVTKEDVAAVCTPNISDKVYEIVNAICSKKAATALKLYSDMISRSTAPQQVLHFIIQQFRNMLRALIMTKEGKSLAEIGEAILNGNGRRAFYIVEEGRRFGEEKLRTILAELLETETATKNGNLDVNDACMLIIMKYSE